MDAMSAAPRQLVRRAQVMGYLGNGRVQALDLNRITTRWW